MTTPFTPWRAGQTITADRLNATAPLAWQTWTPAWSTESGNNKSAYGNAVLNCRYVQFGLAVMFNVDITFGSTTSFASSSDNWTFGLPVPAALSDGPLGYASLYMGSVSANVAALPNLYGTGTFKIFVSARSVASATATAGGWVDATTPFTWASGYRLLVSGQYETAA